MLGVELKPGARFRSAVCGTELVVVRGAGSVDLRCGGRALVPIDQPPEDTLGAIPPFDGGTLLGKRYADDDLGVEVLCTKPGAGSLSIGDRALAERSPKPLPSSD